MRRVLVGLSVLALTLSCCTGGGIPPSSYPPPLLGKGSGGGGPRPERGPSLPELRGGGNVISRVQYAIDTAIHEDDWEQEGHVMGGGEEEREERARRAEATQRRLGGLDTPSGPLDDEEGGNGQEPPAPAPAPRTLGGGPRGKLVIEDKDRKDFKQKRGVGAQRYDYDCIVIGGGSGGLACSKEAAKLGAKVAVCDFVTPTPSGVTWGLGGTCVNVGCIPKKLMHKASLLREAFDDAESYGWGGLSGAKHSWEAMVGGVQDHIASLNFGYRAELRTANVTYLNELASFSGPHSLTLRDKDGRTREVTANCFVVAVGGRPKYPGVPGDEECCITSDDLFSLAKPPGKTLVVGASYVALECAGFVTGLGFNATVMMRSIPLRGFDQECAEKVCDAMRLHGTGFIRGAVPTGFKKVPGEGGVGTRVEVTWEEKGEGGGKKEGKEVFDTVLLAIGRYALTDRLQLDKAGVEIDKGSLKIKGTGGGVGAEEGTTSPHVFAVGDVLLGRPELTPVAIQAGILLARRLFGGGVARMDYEGVATTVFTPLEYSCAGLSDEEALERYGEGGLEVFTQLYRPLEWSPPGMAYPAKPTRAEAACFAKLITVPSEGGRVVGLHLVGDGTGEVVQGFALAMKLGATKGDFDGLVGVHPTSGEVLTTMDSARGSEGGGQLKGC